MTSAKCVSCAAQTPRVLLSLSACKSSVWRDLRHQASRTPVHRPSASTDNLAFQNWANHRSWSRPPSRRQPFRSTSRDQSEKSVEKSLKFPRRLRVEFTAASTGLTLLAHVGTPFERWSERPHRWPQAWQANRPFRVVAHATVLLLATAPAAAPPGGRHRPPPEDDVLQPPRRSAVAGCAH